MLVYLFICLSGICLECLPKTVNTYLQCVSFLSLIYSLCLLRTVELSCNVHHVLLWMCKNIGKIYLDLVGLLDSLLLEYKFV